MAPVAGGALAGETGSQALLQSNSSPEQCSRAYLSMTSEGSGATELSLDAIISSLAENADPEAEKITTRARELRDARGRDRIPVVSRVAALFDHIHVREKLDGKWKDRKLADVEADVQKALSNAAKECLAGLRRQARPAEEEQSATAASSAASAAEHAGNAASSGGLRRPSELTSESSAAKKPSHSAKEDPQED